MLAIKFLIVIMFDCFVCISCIIAVIQGKINKNIIKCVIVSLVTVNLFIILMIISENNLIGII